MWTMAAFLGILIPIAMVVVVIILATGIGGMLKGGDFNRRYANKLMQMRVAAQAVAVVLIMIAAWLASR